MNIKFINPQYLWLLSLLSVVIILHLIRPRRVLVPIPTLLLWEKILKENPTGKWFKKLPKNLLLYLQILTLALLVLSLAQPQLTFRGNINLPLVLIIDCSASTSARDILPSRFENMKKEAISIVNKSPLWKPIALIKSGYRPEIVSSFTVKHDLIEKNIKDLKVLYTKNNIQEAISLAESLLPNTSKDIHIFFDGTFFFTFPSNSINNYYVHIFGKDDDNVGITNAKIFSKNKKISELFIEISNFSSKIKYFPIEIYQSNKIIDKRDLSIKPQEIKKLIFEIPYTKEKIKINLNLKDQLLEDNTAYLYLPIIEPKILLVSPGNPFLEKALKVIPNSTVDIKKEIYQEDFESYDFIVFDRLIPKEVPSGNYMFIGFVPRNLNFELIGTLIKAKIVSWEEVPLMNSVHPIGVNVESSLLFRSEDSKPFLYSERGAIGFIYDKNNIFAVVLAFSILDSDWYYYDSFPIFIYNLINYALSYDPQRYPGEPISFRDNNQKIIVETPIGKKEITKRSENFEFWDAYNPGFYIFRSKDNEKIFAVNVFSKEESDIKPKYRVENYTKNKIDESGFINFALTPYTIGLTFIFLILEIILFLGGFKYK